MSATARILLLSSLFLVACPTDPEVWVPEVQSTDAAREQDAFKDIAATTDVPGAGDAGPETVTPMDAIGPPADALSDSVESDLEDTADAVTLDADSHLCGADEDCDDDNPCTQDQCLPGTGCKNTPVVEVCDDGDPCTVGDMCIDGECQSGEGTLECDDGNACTDDACEPTVGCQYANNAADCDDNNPCTEGDVCNSGACLPGPNECGCKTDEECIELDDGNLCNGTLYCNQEATPPSCDLDPESVVVCEGPDQGPCLALECQSETGQCETVPYNEGGACDDESSCTADDVCVEGTCKGTPVPSCGVGAPCQAWDDCANGLTCFDGMPGGYCTVLNCKVAQCPGGTKCSPINDGDLDVCMVPCGADSDCREEDGHGCTDGGGCWCGDEICTAGEGHCMGEVAGTCNTCGSALEPGAVDCAESDQFCLEGECVDCIPDCNGKSCGDDGCGGSCGVCDVWSGEACIDDTCQCASVPGTVFNQFYKQGDEDYAYVVAVDTDGNYVIGGDSYETSVERVFHLMRVDQTGKLVCSQYLPGNGTNRIRALAPLANGVMALAGTHSPNKSSGYPTKWDFSFHLSLSSSQTPCNMDKNSLSYFGSANYEEPNDMEPLPNGAGYVMAGYRQTSADSNERDMWIVTTNLSGEPNLPGIQYGDAGRQEARAIEVVADGFVVAGFSGASGQALLVKFSPAGTVLWAQELGLGEAHDLVVTDAGFAVGGFQNNDVTAADAHLWVTDSSGNVVANGEWAGAGSDKGYGLAAHPNGGFVLVGDTTTNASGTRDGFVVRFSDAGTVLWKTQIGQAMEDFAKDVLVDSSGRIVLAGYGENAAEYAFAKTDFWLAMLQAECQ
jgi:hypothetical protein